MRSHDLGTGTYYAITSYDTQILMTRQFSDEVCDLVSKEKLGDVFIFTGTYGGAFTSAGCGYKGVQGVDRHRTWQVKDLDLVVS
jgi:hypothetical protein